MWPCTCEQVMRRGKEHKYKWRESSYFTCVVESPGPSPSCCPSLCVPLQSSRLESHQAIHLGLSLPLLEALIDTSPFIRSGTQRHGDALKVPTVTKTRSHKLPALLCHVRDTVCNLCHSEAKGSLTSPKAIHPLFFKSLHFLCKQKERLCRRKSHGTPSLYPLH